MTKAKLFLGVWAALLLAIAGGTYYFIVLKNGASPVRVEKLAEQDKLLIGEIGGWFRGFADKNKTLYPATEFTMNASIGDKREEPFYAITLGGLNASDVAGVERKLAGMGLVYVSDFDGVRYSFLILFEDKNAMMLNFNTLKQIYPFARQGTM